MGINAPWYHELPGRLVHLLAGQRVKVGLNFGDPSVGCRAHIG
jgi:hypothetical protein